MDELVHELDVDEPVREVEVHTSNCKMITAISMQKNHQFSGANTPFFLHFQQKKKRENELAFI